MTTEQDYRVAIGAYVLGGLQPDEATELESHLDGCPDCQRELAEFTDTAAQLALVPPELLVETLTQEPPPASVAPAGEVVQGADPTTRVSGRVTLAAAPWGTKLQAKFTGEPRGEKCQLWVVSTAGERQIAANWTVTAAAAAGAGTNLQGSVSIPKADIARLVVRTFAGRPLLAIDV